MKVFLECRWCGKQLGDGMVKVRKGALVEATALCNDCIEESVRAQVALDSHDEHEPGTGDTHRPAR